MQISKKRLREIIQEELTFDRDDEDIDPFEEEDEEPSTGPEGWAPDFRAPGEKESAELVYRGMKYHLPEDPGLRQAAQQEMERLINAFFDEEA